MSDLIDREDLINGIYNDNPKDVLAYIAEFPSAEPKYVRCGECHWNDGAAYCEFHFRDVKGDWCCPWGEKDE